MQCLTPGAEGSQRVGKLCGDVAATVGCDQLPGARDWICDRRRRFVPLPFHGEQSFGEYAVTLAALGFPGAHPQARGLQHDLAVGVGDVEIRLDRGGI